MDKTTLVRNDQEIEGLIMDALSKIRMPVTLLTWNRDPETDEKQLIIATPWYDLKGPRKAWEAAIDAFEKAGIYKQVPMLRVYLKSPNDSDVKSLAQGFGEEREGALHLLSGGKPHQMGKYSVFFAPFLGSGGAVPARRFSRIEDLRNFLVKSLHQPSRLVDDSLHELAERGNVSILPVSLKERELKKAGLV